MTECETALWVVVILIASFGLICFLQEVRRKRYLREEQRRKR